jgi:membrane-bound lytic murein transglycosylase D
MFISGRVGRILLLTVLLGSAGLVQAENFPLPDSLKPNVEFWKRVFSEIDGQQGFMHDSRNLALVYETIQVPKGSSRRQRKQLVEAARTRIKNQLYRIASKPYDRLSEADKKIRRLFPADAFGPEIRAAARHIRFQLGQADKFREAIRRSGYYHRYIVNRLQAENMPVELAALPFVESSFNVRANSHVGASGIWQFMPATGRRFMKVNHVIDERYDPYRATDAAVRLLSYNYSIVKSWPLALTAYNHGVGGMRRAIRKTGTTDIGVIVKQYRSRTFGFASRNFYAEFLAVLELSQNPEKYFPGVKPNAPQELIRFELDHYVPARVLAKAIGVKLDKLRRHNLALREPVWDGEKRVPARYELRLPKHLATGHIDKQLRKIPLTARFDKQVPDKTYRVRRGDSLSRIAALYGVKVSDLVMMNNLRSRHRIRIGQVLYLPQKGQLVKPKVSTPEPVVAAVIPVKQDQVIDQPTAVIPPETLLASVETQQAVQQAVQMQETVDGGQQVSVSEPAEQIAEVAMVEDEILESAQQISATDPAEYSVARDNTIEVQAAETLGHYADWLGIKTQRLRRINRMSYRTPLVIGKRLKLDFSSVNTQLFEARRLAYHKQLEDGFFADYRIEGTREYIIQRGDSLWVIVNKHQDTPLWLVRQYNPDVDFSRLKPGDNITLPAIVKKI